MYSKKIIFIISIFLLIFLFSFIFLQFKKQGINKDLSEIKSHKDLCLKNKEIRSAAIEWLKNNFRNKGLWHYIYIPQEDEFPNKNNAIRQLMTSALAAKLAKSNDEIFLNYHKKNLEFIFKYWYKERDNEGYIFYNNKSKLGANAMFLRTLTYSPWFEQYKNEAEKIATSITNSMNKEGEFKPFFIEPDYKYDKDYLLTFYSGEAILSLVDYYNKTGNKYYLEKAILAQNFYLKKYVKNIKENYYPAYVPWHTQSLNKLYKITKDNNYIEAIFTMNDELVKIQDKKEYLGRFYNPKYPEYGSPHVSSDAVYTEGLAYAYEIAVSARDQEHKNKYLESLKLAIKNLESLQFKEKEMDDKKYKKAKIFGGIRYKKGDDRIRVDNMQHTIDATMKIEEVVNCN